MYIFHNYIHINVEGTRGPWGTHTHPLNSGFRPKEGLPEILGTLPEDSWRLLGLFLDAPGVFCTAVW